MASVLRELLSLKRNERRDPSALAALRDAKLRRLVKHAYHTTAYYRRRFDEAGVAPEDIRTIGDLARVPLSNRADLQSAGSDLTSRAFDAASLQTEKTSGSSGRPFELRVDRRWTAVRNAMFLRALSATGYRPGRRMMLITSGERRDRSWPLRWRYVPFTASPAQMVEDINAFRPWLLYGWVTPLRRLAEHVRDHGGLDQPPRAIVTTAEPLDAATRSLLTGSLRGEVFQFYGLTEMGAMAWECRGHDGLHTADDVVVTECVDGRLVLTNLELRATPLLRYDCGDLGTFMAGACPCGRSFRRLSRIEGRLVDCVVLADGRTVSPYQLTLALEDVPSLARYQVVQEAVDRFEVRYVQRPGSVSDPERIVKALRPVLGRAAIEVRRRDSLEPEAGRKFRVVESHLGRGEGGR